MQQMQQLREELEIMPSGVYDRKKAKPRGTGTAHVGKLPKVTGVPHVTKGKLPQVDWTEAPPPPMRRHTIYDEFAPYLAAVRQKPFKWAILSRKVPLGTSAWFLARKFPTFQFVCRRVNDRKEQTAWVRYIGKTPKEAIRLAGSWYAEAPAPAPKSALKKALASRRGGPREESPEAEQG
jgi:hypothetical protein